MKLNNLSKISSNILLSRITGMFRDVLFANFLGASALSDAFMFAFRLPNLFRRILAEGAINSVFIPMYLDHNTKSKSETEIFLPISSFVIPSFFSTASSTGKPWVSQPALLLT